jgi:hypothetical protein
VYVCRYSINIKTIINYLIDPLSFNKLCRNAEKVKFLYPFKLDISNKFKNIIYKFWFFYAQTILACAFKIISDWNLTI